MSNNFRFVVRRGKDMCINLSISSRYKIKILNDQIIEHIFSMVTVSVVLTSTY